jgi:hypothetical protein
MMQVDALALREIAAKLLDQVDAPLGRACTMVTQAGSDVAITTTFDNYATFDDYATPGPYRELTSCWQAELGVLRRAVGELVAAMKQTADEYGDSDERAESRLGPR